MSVRQSLVSIQNQEQHRLQEFFKSLYQSCAYCMFVGLGYKDSEVHTVRHCPYGGKDILGEVIEWRQQITLPDSGYCYICCNPEWLCPGNSLDSCLYRDTTLLLAFLSWVEYRDYIGRCLGEVVPEEVVSFQVWAMTPDLCFGKACNKALKMVYNACLMIGILQPYESEGNKLISFRPNTLVGQLTLIPDAMDNGAGKSNRNRDIGNSKTNVRYELEAQGTERTAKGPVEKFGRTGIPLLDMLGSGSKKTNPLQK